MHKQKSRRPSSLRLFCCALMLAVYLWPAQAKANVLELTYLYIKSFSGKKEDAYRMGVELYRAGRKEEALVWLRDATAKGLTAADVFLADIYVQGIAAPESDAEGFRVFLHAVQQERYKAQPFFCRYASYSADHVLPDVRKTKAICGNTYRPLIFEIKGDGLRFARKEVYFDLHDDGYAVATDWPRFDMGILVHDKNGNGIIDSGREMIAGRVGEAANGFIALAAYDTNGDGVLTNDDTAWSDLRIWRDVRQDGKINAAGAPELFTLDDLNITSIALNYQNVNTDIKDNKVWQQGTFMIDGQEHHISAVLLDAHVMNTHYLESGKIPLPEKLQVAPNLRGYGTVKDLHDQLARDADVTDPQSLAAQIRILQNYTLENVFLPETPLEEIILGIMFRSAEVDGIDPVSRGRNIDARALRYLEKVTNKEFLQRGVTFDPRPQAAGDLKEAFSMMFKDRAGKLLVQTAARSLLAGSDVKYSAQRDRFYGVKELDDAVLAELVIIAKGLPDTPARQVFWRRVSFVQHAAFPQMSGVKQYVKLAQAIKDSDADLDAEKLTKGDFSYEYLPLVDPRKKDKSFP